MPPEVVNGMSRQNYSEIRSSFKLSVDLGIMSCPASSHCKKHAEQLKMAMHAFSVFDEVIPKYENPKSPPASTGAFVEENLDETALQFEVSVVDYTRSVKSFSGIPWSSLELLGALRNSWTFIELSELLGRLSGRISRRLPRRSSRRLSGSVSLRLLRIESPVRFFRMLSRRLCATL